MNVEMKRIMANKSFNIKEAKEKVRGGNKNRGQKGKGHQESTRGCII